MEDRGIKLHDRSTRGEPLTAEEEAELVEWYATQDQEEDALLSSSSKSSLTLDALRTEVEIALTHLEATAQQVRAQSEENIALRREIAKLSQKLARTLQPV